MTFDAGDDLPMELLSSWINESYRAVAPKSLVKLLDGGSESKPTKTKKRSKK